MINQNRILEYVKSILSYEKVATIQSLFIESNSKISEIQNKELSCPLFCMEVKLRLSQ